MGAATGKARYGTLLAEPMAERRSKEGLAEPRHKERQVVRRCAIKDRLQIGMNWNREFDPGFGLLHMKCAVPDVLAAHSKHVGPALARIEQQCKGQAWLQSDWVHSLELRDFIVRPAMVTIRLDPHRTHISGRVVDSQSGINGVLHHRSQYLAQAVRRIGLLSP